MSRELMQMQDDFMHVLYEATDAQPDTAGLDLPAAFVDV